MLVMDNGIYYLMMWLYYLLAFYDRDFILVSTGTYEYTFTKQDIGRRLVFVYIPINFEGLSFNLYLVEAVNIILYSHEAA